MAIATAASAAAIVIIKTVKKIPSRLPGCKYLLKATKLMFTLFTSTGTKSFNVSVDEIGTQMLSTSKHGYILPFEVVSILLLAAMVGCIVIAMKPSEPEPVAPPLVTVENIEDKPTSPVVVIPSVSAPLIIEEV